MIEWCAARRAEYKESAQRMRDAGCVTAAEFVERDIKVLATIESCLTETMWREAQR